MGRNFFYKFRYDLIRGKRNLIMFNFASYRSTVAQMAKWAPQDQKVPSLIPALDPMRRVSKNRRIDLHSRRNK